MMELSTGRLILFVDQRVWEIYGELALALTLTLTLALTRTRTLALALALAGTLTPTLTPTLALTLALTRREDGSLGGVGGPET